MRCLNCNSIDIGKIGPKQYFCWDCCIEMTIDGDKIDVYQVEKDGTVSSLNDLFFEEAAEEGFDVNVEGFSVASGE